MARARASGSEYSAYVSSQALSRRRSPSDELRPSASSKVVARHYGFRASTYKLSIARLDVSRMSDWFCALRPN